MLMMIILLNLCSGPCSNCFWTRFGRWLRGQRSGHCSGQFDDNLIIREVVQMLTNIIDNDPNVDKYL